MQSDPLIRDYASMHSHDEPASQMAVWIVNHYADPPEGMATRSFDIARRLVQQGVPATIFTSNFNHYRFTSVRHLGLGLWKQEELDGVRMVWIRTTPYRRNDWRRLTNMLSFGLLALAAGLLRRDRPSVVVGVSVHPLAAVAGYLLSRAKRARFFFEVTDLWPQSLVELGRLRPESSVTSFLRWLERFLFRRCERIIMLWRHTDSYVASQGISPLKIVWIPHGVELSRYKSLRPYDGAPNRPFRVTFMGAFVESMALDTILSAAALLQKRGRSDITFRLVGAGTYRQSIIAEANRMSLECVDFPPAVPKSEIAKVMNEADAFIYGLRDLPIYQYGMSLNKLTDYLAGARPIIFYGKSSYDPVRQATAGITVPPADPEALADAIEQLANLSPQERIQMGANGRKYLEQFHNIPILADRFMEVLRSGGTRQTHPDSNLR